LWLTETDGSREGPRPKVDAAFGEVHEARRQCCALLERFGWSIQVLHHGVNVYRCLDTNPCEE
jgi:hypothetical protein